MILSLVASVATDYIQLRGLDEQLAVAKRTLDTYADSVKLFELQFKYGQVSQMNVAQVAVAVRDSRRADSGDRIARSHRLENALSVLLGRNPGPIERGKSIHQLTLPRSRRPAFRRAPRATARPHAVGTAARRRQRANRRREGALLPDDLAHRIRLAARARTCRTCSPVRRGYGATPARRSDRSSHSAQSAGRSRRPRRASRPRSRATSSRSRMRSPTSTMRSSQARSSTSSSLRSRSSSTR